MGRTFLLGCKKKKVFCSILTDIGPLALISFDRTRKATLAAEILFDDSQNGEGKQQAVQDEFEDAKPLAEELIDTLIDLLFFADFTLPKLPTGKNKVTYAIWQSGVGCNTPVGTSKEFESNRCEVLRLLLTLSSKVFRRKLQSMNLQLLTNHSQYT